MSFDLQIINGDLVIKNGDFAIVQDKEKLIQDILKICITPVGANSLNPWYGSFINQTLIGSHLDEDITISVAKNQIEDCLENLKKLQQLQMSSTNQRVTPDELIAAVSEVIVKHNEIDPRLYEISVKVLSKSFSQTTVSFPVR